MKDHRHRVEHALSPTATALEQMAEHGIAVCTHPQWIYKWVDRARLLKFLDRERGVIPLKSYLQHNISVAFGADPPAFPRYQPQLALWQAAARITKHNNQFNTAEAIPVKTALRLQTMGSAYAGFQEKELGSIEKGKCADFAVWKDDFYKAPVDRVKDIQAEMTIVNGKVIYDRKQEAKA
jgi:predicted amidohydrolase YtcJ